ncbi:MAG: ABC transporter permease [Chloroflexi bacterium]|nr:ABC transporter permease [Chloroflexota bacterium]
MSRIILERLSQAVFVVFGVSLLSFMLVHLTGDPAALLLPLDASQEDRDRFRAAMGLDRPLLVQYVDFVVKAVQGDFGNSLRFQQPAMGLVVERLPATLALAVTALAMALAVGVPAGLIAGVKRNSLFDRVAMVLALAGQCVPAFWLGLMLILLFSVGLRLLPVSGGGTVAHLILPGLTLSCYTMALVARLLRSNMLDVMNADYVRTARAKGLAERAIVVRHALKNAAIPVVTVVGLSAGYLLGGAVIVEQVFAYPGLGRLVYQSISNRDVAVVQAFVVLISLVVLAINLTVDLAYTLLDPRVRYE